MPQAPPTTVEIYNHKYTISNTEAQADYIHNAAVYLDSKMQEAAAVSGPRAPLDIAILAAMQIASEILAKQQHKDTLLDQTDEQISRFTERLENQQQHPLDPAAEAEDDSSSPPRF